MERLVKTYQPKDKSKNRNQKRAQEMEILKLFGKEGEELKVACQAPVVSRKAAKEQAEQLRETEKQESAPNPYPDVEKLNRPPPYANEEALKQCPVIKGTVAIEGQLEWDRSAEDKNELKEIRERDKRDRQEQIEAIQQDQEELKHEISVLRGLREQKAIEEYSLRYERRAEEKSRKSDAEQAKRDDERQGETKAPVPKEWEELEIASNSELEGDLLRSSVCKGKKGQQGMMLPLLIKEAKHPQYIPWGTQDLEELKNTLPSLREGAGKWIRAFEDKTTGQLLAIGDLKALLVRLVGLPKLKKIMVQACLKNVADNPMIDVVRFDRVRQNVWQAFRDCFPPKMDPQALRGNPLGESENPAAYLEKQLKKWRLETKQDRKTNQLLTTTFQNSIIEAMPSHVRSRLEEVVGLTSSMSHREFRDHVAHAVERFRKDKEKLFEQQE
ncbi:hypothetical protein chiPu_0014389 [Chiloscyllium punctatum]|uniref:Uncharacterized protein n=1 Tax=Chiloscyllium punctatum TaxID=137246 RepID=A0A401SZT8_CHIPU|nr:hypothetical protein [Chiloscyllium punctatum]